VSSFGEIRYKGSHIAVYNLRLSRKSTDVGPHFCGLKWNYIYTCCVNEFEYLDVKNALVESKYCVTAFNVCTVLGGRWWHIYLPLCLESINRRELCLQ
jgi:hypothetical protein